MKRIGNFDHKTFSRDFDSRLIFQKSIYLMQAFGLYIGVPFSWYLHGPYSMVLARHGYELTKKYDKLPVIQFATVESEKRFDRFLSFLGERRTDARWLEALASLHFLRNTYPTTSKDNIILMVMRKQSHLSKQECLEAWSYLVKYTLIRDCD